MAYEMRDEDHRGGGPVAKRSLRIKARVILSGVPSRTEEADGTSGGWWTGERGRNGVEGSRTSVEHSTGILRLRAFRCAKRRSAQDDTRNLENDFSPIL